MRVDYSDQFAKQLDSTDANSIETYARSFFSSAPKWIIRLFKCRNTIVSFLGLKGSKIPKDRDEIIRNCQFNLNDKIGLFQVMRKTKDEIILGQNDYHLDFRIIIGKKLVSEDLSLFISTEIQFHNFLGKVYFIVIKPFHRLIAQKMLHNMVKTAKCR
ncbi:MAG: DUF2867 domain-containing protein [Bacteroidota bacterium]